MHTWRGTQFRHFPPQTNLKNEPPPQIPPNAHPIRKGGRGLCLEGGCCRGRVLFFTKIPTFHQKWPKFAFLDPNFCYFYAIVNIFRPVFFDQVRSCQWPKFSIKKFFLSIFGLKINIKFLGGHLSYTPPWYATKNKFACNSYFEPPSLVFRKNHLFT